MEEEMEEDFKYRACMYDGSRDCWQVVGAGGDTKDSDKKASGDVVELRLLSSSIRESGEAEWFSNVVEGFRKI